MQMLDVVQLENLLPKDKTKAVRAMLRRADTEGVAVYRAQDSSVLAVPVTSGKAEIPNTRTDGARLIGVYPKPVSKVRKAIRYMQDNPGTGPAAAARRFGITSQNISITLAREKRRQTKNGQPLTCPCCGQPIPEPTE
jgi:hypothetical protein